MVCLKRIYIKNNEGQGLGKKSEGRINHLYKKSEGCINHLYKIISHPDKACLIVKGTVLINLFYNSF